MRKVMEEGSGEEERLKWGFRDLRSTILGTEKETGNIDTRGDIGYTRQQVMIRAMDKYRSKGEKPHSYPTTTSAAVVEAVVSIPMR